MKSKMSGLLYVISGPSGAGKSTVIENLLKNTPGLAYSISHTSRKPRGEEKDGVDYHFTAKEAFEQMIREGEFVEWAEVYGDYYGTSLSGLKMQRDRGLDVVMDVDVQGAKNIKQSFEESILVFILPPSLEILERRLKNRGTESEEAVKNRIEKALKEVANCVWYDYLILNEDLDRAVQEASSIVISERCRRSRQLSRVRSLFKI
ncbi:MAG: guanylate kinase [Pseudomonadota bacterium]